LKSQFSVGRPLFRILSIDSDLGTIDTVVCPRQANVFVLADAVAISVAGDAELGFEHPDEPTLIDNSRHLVLGDSVGESNRPVSCSR